MKNKAQMLTIKQASQVVEGITEYRIRQMCISVVYLVTAFAIRIRYQLFV